MRVLIIGAGIGGLVLAQRLRRDGFDVAVRERDAGVETRFQGYRIGLGAPAVGVLADSLPTRLRPLLHAIGGDVTGPGRLVDTRLNVLGETPPQDEGTLFDRHVLRMLLLAGLDERIEFDRKLDRFEVLDDHRARVHYADGTTETADLVVAADGMGSTVRRQLLPSVRIRPMGKFGAIGRTPLTDRFAALVPGWSTLVNTPTLQLFLGKMPFRRPPDEAAAELAPEVALPATPSYLRWVMMIPPDLPADLAALEEDPDAALALLTELTADWHPELRAVITAADRANSGIGALRTSDPIPPWPTGPVTLLGDAAHPAPPGGLGANLALADVDLLGRTLRDVRDGRAELIPALAGYERRIRDDGGAALEQANERLDSFDRLREHNGTAPAEAGTAAD